ncbi:LLM class flavin-dependent oxidoreductase [Paenibacillus radicis (ex Xue et al. 2023)]|uniref:LLM class flavin-dependent oxidoreductase n=1 Tax=Paenibacillus radicis (ex Xue et al. 2023) TaxID=2972489 RepID=A0ABT1YNR5_9BACL|nr:LLM class flavin-dependent oxidoreductase [Paenibacillus radicis (ex Xue et al. 2023)]MCR8634677.1 LLM class flavin-dependent oxidoreductase [Paenibacillus radicis (ex Xue et al. 2023)]
MGLRLSILDQSPIGEKETASEAFQNTVKLAQKAEELGYYRFWVSEHHDSDRLAGSSPEVLISYLLAKTKKIRVGSGGVMLQHYSPYKVAENFNVLASLEPGRVDLGIGRAPGGLPRSTRALQQDAYGNSKSLGEKLVELKQFLANELDVNDPLHGVRATPFPQKAADLYLLGASIESAGLAASLGIPYVFSQSINCEERTISEAFELYRSQFQPGNLKQPQAILALSVILTNTDEEAEQLAAANSKIFKIRLESGRTLTVRSIEQIEEYGRQTTEPYTIEETKANIIYGSKETVRQKLIAIQHKYQIDELIISVALPEFAKRLYAYVLLQEAFSELTV